MSEHARPTVTPVVGRGDAFWERLREEHGDDLADDVYFASRPIDERIEILEALKVELEARRDEMVDANPRLKAIGRG